MRPSIHNLIPRRVGRWLLGLALIGGLGMAMGSTPAAHAGGFGCGSPSITASEAWGSVQVAGQCFSPGGAVYVYVYDNTNNYSPTGGWAYAGTASTSSFNCSGGSCYYLPGGKFTYTTPGPGCADHYFTVWAYDAMSGYEPPSATVRCTI